jgi:hypothetical protein
LSGVLTKKLCDRPAAVVERNNRNQIMSKHQTKNAQGGSQQRPCSAQELFNAAFSGHRSPRSPEYKAGVLAHLCFALKETGIHNPYAEGTAQSDAWYAGVQESWIILQANGVVSNESSSPTAAGADRGAERKP